MATQQTFRIDIHHHLVPPEYVAALARIGVTGAGGEDFPAWSPEQTLAERQARSRHVSREGWE